MSKQTVKILDCTLRDGGFINDWEFGQDTLNNIFERLVSSRVEFIEVGFLDERRKFDINRSIMPDSASVEEIFGKNNKGNAIIVAMIDYGTCSIENLQPCSESYLDGIRVIFKKHIMYEAIEFCRQVKSLGYKVFTQAVSITSYNDEELLELVSLVNDLSPYALSLVDTYGLLHQDNLNHIVDVFDEHLDPEICIGYHAHNNFQLGYSNCIEILNKSLNRTVLVDASLYGMGKSAGNAPIELVSAYMNTHHNKCYDIHQMLEAIETSIMDIYYKVPWGYNLFYYIAAVNRCHPNYVSYLMNKRTLSIKSINLVLDIIEPEKKLLYDKSYIEELYIKYQTKECDDREALRRLATELQGTDVLLIGPGKSVIQAEGKIKDYIANYRPVVIPVNFVPGGYEPSYIFITNSKRYTQMASKFNELASVKTIATSNITKTSGEFSFVLNYSALIDTETEIPDNSLVMLLKTLKTIKVSSVQLAGFDGYSLSDINYFNTNMEYSFAKEKAQYLNGYVKNFLRNYMCEMNVAFLTKSFYEDDYEKV